MIILKGPWIERMIGKKKQKEKQSSAQFFWKAREKKELLYLALAVKRKKDSLPVIVDEHH